MGSLKRPGLHASLIPLMISVSEILNLVSLRVDVFLAWLPECHIGSLSKSIGELPTWHEGSHAGRPDLKTLLERNQYEAEEIKMGKQKIVMKVAMKCKKCQTKALRAVTGKDGVSSVGLEGEERNKVVVIGDGVDAVDLAKTLRKKLGGADIISVSQL